MRFIQNKKSKTAILQYAPNRYYFFYHSRQGSAINVIIDRDVDINDFILIAQTQIILFDNDEFLIFTIKKLDSSKYKLEFLSSEKYTSFDKSNQELFYEDGKNIHRLAFKKKSSNVQLFEKEKYTICDFDEMIGLPFFKKNNQICMIDYSRSNDKFNKTTTFTPVGNFIEFIDPHDKYQVTTDYLIEKITPAVETDPWINNIVRSAGRQETFFYRTEIDGQIFIDSNIFINPIPDCKCVTFDDKLYFHIDETTVRNIWDFTILTIKKRNESPYVYMNSCLYPYSLENGKDFENMTCVTSEQHSRTMWYNEQTLKSNSFQINDNGIKAVYLMSFSNDIIVIFENEFKLYTLDRNFSYVITTKTFSLQNEDIISVDSMWITNVLNEQARNMFGVSGINVSNYMTGKELLNIFITTSVTSVIWFDVSSGIVENASGTGVIRHIHGIIQKYLKEIFLTKNLWSKVNPESMKNNDLLNAYLYCLTLLKNHSCLNFRLPVQILSLITQKELTEEELEYFFKKENPDHYKKWMENKDPSVYGHETKIDVLKDHLFFDPEVDAYFKTHQLLIDTFLNVNSIFYDRIPNIATLDWYYSGEFDFSHMKTAFLILMNIHSSNSNLIDFKTKMSEIINEMSIVQFENLLVNISATNRIIGTGYSFYITECDAIRFSACSVTCNIPVNLFLELDKESIINLISNPVKSLDDKSPHMISATVNFTPRNRSGTQALYGMTRPFGHEPSEPYDTHRNANRLSNPDMPHNIITSANLTNDDYAGGSSLIASVRGDYDDYDRRQFTSFYDDGNTSLHDNSDRYQITSLRDNSDRYQITSFPDDSDRHQIASFHDDPDRRQNPSFHEDVFGRFLSEGSSRFPMSNFASGSEASPSAVMSNFISGMRQGWQMNSPDPQQMQGIPNDGHFEIRAEVENSEIPRDGSYLTDEANRETIINTIRNAIDGIAPDINQIYQQYTNASNSAERNRILIGMSTTIVDRERQNPTVITQLVSSPHELINFFQNANMNGDMNIISNEILSGDPLVHDFLNRLGTDFLRRMGGSSNDTSSDIDIGDLD